MQLNKLALLLCLAALAACSSTNTISLKQSEGKFEKEVYTIRSGEPIQLVLNGEEFQRIEIKGTEILLDKENKKKKVTIETPGMYEISGSLGEGNFIKATLEVQ